MKTKIALLLFSVCACIACTPTTSDNALQLLDEATSHYIKGQYNSAKLLIDSIHGTYPRRIDVRKEACNLLYQIERDETDRTLVYLDSVMPMLRQQWQTECKQFVLADTIYLPKPVYQHRNLYKQQPTTTLLCEVDEQGNVSLISVYNGRSLDHVSVKVACKDIYAQTDSVLTTSVYNYRFADLGSCWEYVTFDKIKQSDVLGFISMYADEPLKISLFGKRTYTYYLSKTSARAIKESLLFAQTTAQLYQMKQEYKKLIDKQLWLENKLSAPQN